MTVDDKIAPVACTLSPGEFSQRRDHLVKALFSRVTETRELGDGFEFVFPGDESLVTALAEFIRFERSCCRFLTFDLLFEPNRGPLRLRILGAPEAKQIIREMFAG